MLLPGPAGHAWRTDVYSGLYYSCHCFFPCSLDGVLCHLYVPSFLNNFTSAFDLLTERRRRWWRAAARWAARGGRGVFLPGRCIGRKITPGDYSHMPTVASQLREDFMAAANRSPG